MWVVHSIYVKVYKHSIMNPSHSVENLSDIEIISEVLRGKRELYATIVHRYNSYLYKVGRAYGYSHADVEDLMQETYINAYTHLGTFENRSSFKTWIVKIMLNECYHKKQKFSYQKEKTAQTDLEEKSVPMFNSQPTDANRIVQNGELKHVLEDAVHQIPEPYRMVFTLRELDGMSVNETSEALNISESNVKVRLNRAKSMLREEIKKVYSPEEIFEFNLIYCDKMVNNVMAAINALPPPDQHPLPATAKK